MNPSDTANISTGLEVSGPSVPFSPHPMSISSTQNNIRIISPFNKSLPDLYDALLGKTPTRITVICVTYRHQTIAFCPNDIDTDIIPSAFLTLRRRSGRRILTKKCTELDIHSILTITTRRVTCLRDTNRNNQRIQRRAYCEHFLSNPRSRRIATHDSRLH